jgi:hypothetical protein
MKVAQYVELEELDDGRKQLTFSQSGLNTLDLCLERGRLLRDVGYDDEPPNDTNAIGTSIHEAISTGLVHLRDTGQYHDVGWLQDLAMDTFATLEDQDGFIWKNYTWNTAERFVLGAVQLWGDELYPILDPVYVEERFGPLVVYGDEHFVLRLRGTIDYIDYQLGLVDWKTAGRSWSPWEKQRWNVQASAYTFAAHSAGLIPAPVGDETLVPFTFVVFVEGREVQVQRLTVTRHAGDWEFLIDKMLRVAKLVEADLDQWPLSDDHALCSEKWCPVWFECKGKYVDDSHYKEYEHGPLKVSDQGVIVLGPKVRRKESA